MYHDNHRSKYNKVVVIGLGQLGLPVAKYVKEKGFDAYGYDISEKAMTTAESNFGIKKASNFNDFDVLIICVSTHVPDDMFSPQVDGLMSVVEKISREAKSGALISIESTIPKGTSQKVFEKLDHRLHVVHAPHRWYALEEQEHGVNQLRILGGVSKCCLQEGLRFYDGKIDSDKDAAAAAAAATAASVGIHALSIPMHPVSSIEVAELTKIIENAHRYLQIAFAEELYLYCKSTNISFAELRDSLNTKWNVNVLEPRDGIGGHCLPKDTKMFINSSNAIKSKILQAAIEADEDYRECIQNRDKENNTSAITNEEGNQKCPNPLLMEEKINK
jgi:UDP-N-acetyl-D-mannosaminuronic acid dehydrogenase